MASIIERKRANKPSKWEAIIRIAGDAKRQLFDTKADAQDFVLKTEPRMLALRASEKSKLEKLRKKSPSHVDFYGRKLRDVIFQFGAPDPTDKMSSEPPISPSSFQSKKRRKSKHGRDIGCHRGIFNTVLKHVGQVTIGEAKRSWVADYVKRMRNTASARGTVYSYGAISKHLALMNAACKRAALEADIDEPKLHFNLESFPTAWKGGRERRLEEWENKAILDVLRNDETVRGKHWLLLYLLALETGARLQELVLAEWREIKQGGAVWTIPAEHTKKKTTRHVSLTAEARSIVAQLKTLATSSTFIFHTFRTVVSVGMGFARRVKKAGVVGLVFHDLRHEAISRLVVHPNKPSMHSIMNMVGHRSYEMLNHYTHLREEEFVGLFD